MAYRSRMPLTDNDIAHFTDAWREAFGETLPAEKARDEAERLLAFYLYLLRTGPPPHQRRPPSPPTHTA